MVQRVTEEQMAWVLEAEARHQRALDVERSERELILLRQDYFAHSYVPEVQARRNQMFERYTERVYGIHQRFDAVMRRCNQGGL